MYGILYNIYIKIDAMFYVFRKFFHFFFLLLTICHPTIGHGRHYATYRYRYTIKCHLQCVYPAVSTIYIRAYLFMIIIVYFRLRFTRHNNKNRSRIIFEPLD